MPPFRFAAHAELATTLASRRDRTCERIERRLLNVRDKPASRVRERQHFAHGLARCFFDDLPRDAAILSEQLDAAHLADGFEPFLQHGRPHQLDAAELIVLAYEHWNRSRWPGASARLQYAHTVWAVFLLRHLQNLALRIWDEGEEEAPVRLQRIQRLLDALNAAVPAGALLRDARWLLQVAQGPLTKGLAPYFRVAERIQRSFAGRDAIAIHAAGAKLAGGHLRSQVRHRAAELQRPTDAADVAAVTRNSNSMDLALLVWDLVPVLEAYADARARNDRAGRLGLADAITQGVSADPDLLLTRLDLLAASTVVETVFVHVECGRPCYTPTGVSHARTLERYAALVDELAPALSEDVEASEPAITKYSPLGIEYGFCGDLLSNMAMDALRGAPSADVALEDVFTTGGDPDAKEARAAFTLSRDWAADVFARTIRALERRAAHRGRANASDTPSASLILLPEAEAASADAQEFCVTSDVKLALATGATAFPRGQIASDRAEGRFLASAETNGRWFGVSKVVLSERLAAGKDARMVVPDEVRRLLKLTCPALIGAQG